MLPRVYNLLAQIYYKWRLKVPLISAAVRDLEEIKSFSMEQVELFCWTQQKKIFSKIILSYWRHARFAYPANSCQTVICLQWHSVWKKQVNILNILIFRNSHQEQFLATQTCQTKKLWGIFWSVTLWRVFWLLFWFGFGLGFFVVDAAFCFYCPPLRSSILLDFSFENMSLQNLWWLCSVKTTHNILDK